MNKKQREEQRRQEDQALVRGMLWAAGAVVLEGLLFLLNRYSFNYNITMESVLLAERLRVVLKVLRVAGLAALVIGAVLAVLNLKKGRSTLMSIVTALTGLIVSVCAHVCMIYHDSGIRMLYLLVPVLGGLALCYYIYSHDFFLCALPAVVGTLGLWFVRTAGFGVEVAATILLCAVVLIVVLQLKKSNGVLNIVGHDLRFLDAKANYTVPMISAAAALAVQVLALVAGATIAYYLIFAMAAWLFALLVYYTVKML